MNKRQAYSIDVNKATLQQLRPAIAELKRRYAISSKAFERRGMEPHPMKTVKARIDARPDLYEKRVGQLSISEARSVYSTYRDYFARQLYDDEGHFVGYRETVTSTVAGYNQYINQVAQEVLNYPDYNRLTPQAQKEIWDIIDKIRDTDPSLFLSNKVSPDVMYQSGTNIKQVMTYIKEGITDPMEILAKIKGNLGDIEAPTASGSPFNF